MDPGGTDPDRIAWERARYAPAVAAMSDTVDKHGVDVELEAQRQHDRTVPPWR